MQPARAPQLVDAAGNPVTYARISVTDRCNLRCFYCVPDEGICHVGQSDMLSSDEILRLAGILHHLGVRKVRLTGGEPLARRGIGRIVRRIGALGFDDLSMTTNAVLLPKFARLLRESGLQRVNISLDSLRPERFEKITGTNALYRVLQGIEAARQVGLIPIKVNMVVVRGLNDDELLDMVRLSADQEQLSVRFIEYMPIGRGTDGYDRSQCVSWTEMLERIRAEVPVEPLPTNDPSAPVRLYRTRGARGTFGFISPMTEHFCATCNRLRLTADGRIKTCLFSRQEPDLLPLLRGSATDDEIADSLRRIVAGKVTEIHTKERSSRNMTRIGG